MAKLFRRRVAGAILAAALATAAADGASAQTVLRVAPIGDLRNIDPIWTTAYITRNHGFLVWDTLFGLDAQGRPQPQMVESYTRSDDGLTWRFVLRDGLKWHDGAPVTAADCVASLRRWGARDAMGRALLGFVSGLEVVDAKTFEMKLRQPVSFVLDALAKVDSSVPFMMPERLAQTDPNQQVPEVIGSGPFIFRRDQWVPGSRVVYERNRDYVPRAEEASGTAGGKHVHVDRVEWRYMPDVAVQVAALNNNEIDLIENPPLDLVTLLQRNPDIVVAEVDPIGSHAFLRPNHTQPPFDKPAVRRALLHAINQTNFLRAAYGDPQYFRPCYSYFGCGTALETTAGSEPYQRPDMNRARTALREAGYNNERVVLIAPSDIPHLNTHAQVAAQMLRQLGVNVDLQTMDWSTVTSRRVSRAPVAEGGWSLTVTANVVMGLESPITNSFAGAACDRSPFGWPCDERIERLRTEFMTSSPEDQKRIAAELTRLYYEVVPYYILGQYRGVTAYRRNLTGVLQSQARLYWNIRKN